MQTDHRIGSRTDHDASERLSKVTMRRSSKLLRRLPSSGKLARSILCIAGLATVTGLIAGMPNVDLLWSASEFLLAAAIVVLPLAFTRHRFVPNAILLATAIAVVAIAVVSGVGQPGVRTGALWANPNQLAAVVTVAVMSTVVAGRSSNAVTLALILSAISGVIATQSRTAFMSLLLATAVFAFTGRHQRYVRSLLLLTLFILAGALLIAMRENGGPNLLRYTSDFSNAAWHSTDRSTIDISPNAGNSPDGKRRATRIVAEGNGSAAYPLLVLSQGGELSQVGAQYVASLYLKARVATEVRLGTNLSSVSCHVLTRWTRCETPSGLGNGRAWAHFLLSLKSPGQRMDILAWGAQLERGTAPTKLSQHQYGVLSKLASLIPTRLTDLGSYGAYVKYTRVGAWAIAWDAFVEQPLRGVGWDTLHKRYVEHTWPSVEARALHPHNVALFLLGGGGLIATLSWLTVAWSITNTASSSALRRLLPLAVLLLGLNTFDNTFFLNGVYITLWLCVGTVLVDEERDRDAVSSYHSGFPWQ